MMTGLTMNSDTSTAPDRLAQLAECIKARRTINFFKMDRVKDEIIQNAIEVARWAPNHKKTEPWHFHILGPSIQKQLKALITDIKAEGQDGPVRVAIHDRLDAIPGWLVISCDVSSDMIRQFEDYAACACAAQNMMLYLSQAGIGVKWTTGKVIRDLRFFELLGLDMRYQMIVGLFWYGYPDHQPEQTRNPLADILRKID